MTEDVEIEALSEHWRKHVESWRSGKDSQAMYCKVHALIYHRFVYWRRKFETEAQSVTRESSGFSRGIVPGVEAGLCVVLPGDAVVRGSADTDTEVQALLAAALALPPERGLRRWTYHCLFGLLAVAGLRIGEALARHWRSSVTMQTLKKVYSQSGVPNSVSRAW